MFAQRLLRTARVRAMSTQQKLTSVHGKGSLDAIYAAFMKNNVTYVSSIVVAAVLFEGIYGTATSALWESMNRGRLYHHVDWTQFKSDLDEEEEEEEEDDE
ncbi:hypothetical protein THRCLA_20604 [Thraustotheca clavata]|uniref:Cytochrome b-c1 complex subunit 9 n=1 Tax=Thraustotheca clavata TaxID=74557 RepID=A0A1W0A5D5_9STRA|nr:hypothetical protein THRCLA_20604 [Thraustotheca clavata]